MARLSPQDIDAQVNSELDDDDWYPITGCLTTTASTWTQESYAGLSPEQREGTPRRVLHKRHGAMPTLNDIEGGWQA